MKKQLAVAGILLLATSFPSVGWYLGALPNNQHIFPSTVQLDGYVSTIGFDTGTGWFPHSYNLPGSWCREMYNDGTGPYWCYLRRGKRNVMGLMSLSGPQTAQVAPDSNNNNINCTVTPFIYASPSVDMSFYEKRFSTIDSQPIEDSWLRPTIVFDSIVLNKSCRSVLVRDLPRTFSTDASNVVVLVDAGECKNYVSGVPSSSCNVRWFGGLQFTPGTSSSWSTTGATYTSTSSLGPYEQSPNIVSCVVSGDLVLNHGSVSKTGVTGSVSTTTLSADCAGNATLTAKLITMGGPTSTVDLGGGVTSRVTLDKSNYNVSGGMVTPIIITSVLSGMAPEAGVHQGDFILVITVM